MIRELVVSIETLAVFVRFQLTPTPQLLELAQAAARIRSGKRYDAVVAALGRRLAHGPKLRSAIPEDVLPQDNHMINSRR